MFTRREKKPRIVAAVNGSWGEDIASIFLRVHGYEIIERNSRPVRTDARYEIDIVAYDKASDTMVFVEVKQHKTRNEYQRRMRSVNRRKHDLLRTACQAWLRRNRWQSSFRFDVIEVYGTPDEKSRPEIDHITNVRLFVSAERFVKWRDEPEKQASR